MSGYAPGPTPGSSRGGSTWHQESRRIVARRRSIRLSICFATSCTGMSAPPGLAAFPTHEAGAKVVTRAIRSNAFSSRLAAPFGHSYSSAIFAPFVRVGDTV
jgi:hypothetical protein